MGEARVKVMTIFVLTFLAHTGDYAGITMYDGRWLFTSAAQAQAKADECNSGPTAQYGVTGVAAVTIQPAE